MWYYVILTIRCHGNIQDGRQTQLFKKPKAINILHIE